MRLNCFVLALIAPAALPTAESGMPMPPWTLLYADLGAPLREASDRLGRDIERILARSHPNHRDLVAQARTSRTTESRPRTIAPRDARPDVAAPRRDPVQP